MTDRLLIRFTLITGAILGGCIAWGVLSAVWNHGRAW